MKGVFKTISKSKKAAAPTNTHRPMKEAKGSQRETMGDKTISEPKKAATQTYAEAAWSKVAFRTPTINCLGNKGHIPSHMKGSETTLEATPTNTHPHMKGAKRVNVSQYKSRQLEGPRKRPHQPTHTCT